MVNNDAAWGYGDYWHPDYENNDPLAKKCECGVDKAMNKPTQLHLHSNWCPKYKDDRIVSTEEKVKPFPWRP